MNYNYDTNGRDDQHGSYVGQEGLLAFPDLLAPAAAARVDTENTRYLQDYGYSRERPKSHSSSYFDSSSFNVSITSNLNYTILSSQKSEVFEVLMG